MAFTDTTLIFEREIFNKKVPTWVAHALVVLVREELVLSQAMQCSWSERLVSRSKALPCRCVTSPCGDGLGGALEGGGRFSLQASAMELATTDLEHAENVLWDYPTFRTPQDGLLRTRIHHYSEFRDWHYCTCTAVKKQAVDVVTGCAKCLEW
jgi:hypothetical protein